MEEQSSHFMRLKSHGIHFTKKYKKARGFRLTYILNVNYLTPHTVQTLLQKDEQWIQWEGKSMRRRKKLAKQKGSHSHSPNIFAGESVKCYSYKMIQESEVFFCMQCKSVSSWTPLMLWICAHVWTYMYMIGTLGRVLLFYLMASKWYSLDNPKHFVPTSAIANEI